MDTVRKRHVLEHRLALLRGHIASVGETPGIERALSQTEAEIKKLDEPRKEKTH